MAVRQRIRRLCWVGAVVLAAAAVAPLTRAASEPLPEVFRGFAHASAVQLELNTNPAQTIPELVRMDLPHGESEIGSGELARGRASTAYPGSTGDAATFMCQVGWPCDDFAPPNWPFTARAEHPMQPHGEAQAQGPGIDEAHLQLAAGRSVADAAADRVATVATAGGVLFGNMGSGELTTETALLSVGSARATTRHEVVDEVLVTTAIAVLEDVAIAGGALRIASIEAHTTSRSDGAGGTAAEPELRVTGVTFAGQEAAITEDGLVVAGSPQDGGVVRSLTGGFSQLLTNGTISVRLVGADDAVEGHTADGMVTGIQVTYNVDGRGFPAGTALVGGFLLGTATSSAQVLPAGAGQIDFDEIDDPGSFTPGAGGFTGGGGGTSVLGEGFAGGSPGGGSDDGAAGVAPGGEPRTEPSPSGGEAGGSGGGLRAGPLERLSETVADRVGLLYVAVALAAVGLAVGVRAPGLRL